jgi:HTH-type transcriptional regulator/antitoxin HigA
MKPKVIKTAAEYDRALAHVASLMDAAPGSSKEAELELWSILVEKYEEEHFPISEPDPIEAIRFRMEQQGLEPSDLVQYFGTKSRVSEVLNGKRSLSLSMIRALNAGLNISAEILVRSPKPKRSAKTVVKIRRRSKMPPVKRAATGVAA